MGVVLQERGHVGIGPAVYGLREIAIGFSRGVSLHFTRAGDGGLLLPLIRKEEEQFVTPVDDVRDDNGAADGEAVLLALENSARFALLIEEEIVGIEIIVAGVIVGSAVDIVGAALGDNADDAAGIAAVFGGVGAFDDAEFSDGVGVGVDDNAVR